MKTKVVFILLAAFIISWPAVAQQANNKPTKPGPNPEMARQRLHERVFRMIAWELSDEMDLPPETEAKFLDILHEHFNERRDLVMEQMSVLKQLKTLSAKPKDQNSEKELQETLKKLDDIKVRQQKSDDNLREKMKNILTVDQQAKFELAWIKVQEKVKNKLINERQKQNMQMKQKQKGKKMQNKKQ